ncbi:hypothetical protein J6590_029349 [Homalodisca vitripennis]|nr:hypothetical protein J6590_029349 [Homalodisca vitripennis]
MTATTGHKCDGCEGVFIHLSAVSRPKTNMFRQGVGIVITCSAPQGRVDSHLQTTDQFSGDNMRIGATVPNFKAESTQGPLDFYEWQGDS